MAETVRDAVPIQFKASPETLAQLKAECRTWYKIEITKHEERIANTREWLEHADGSRGYVFGPGKVTDQEAIMEVRVAELRVTDVVKAIYGPIAP